jgi:hypothetical protein
MFDVTPDGVAIRSDIVDVFRRFWKHLASPGATLTGPQRLQVAAVARDSKDRSSVLANQAQDFAVQLMQSPGTVREDHVRAVADAVGDPQTVEIIAIVSMLSAADSFHRALGAAPASLPEPASGDPTGDVSIGLKRRRTHVPVSPGPIPFALDLVPADAKVYMALHGPLYMTGEEMGSDTFQRSPGLDRAQMELVSSRLSFHNECFY